MMTSAGGLVLALGGMRMESIQETLISGVVTLANVVATNSRRCRVLEEKVDELLRH